MVSLYRKTCASGDALAKLKTVWVTIGTVIIGHTDILRIVVMPVLGDPVDPLPMDAIRDIVVVVMEMAIIMDTTNGMVIIVATNDQKVFSKANRLDARRLSIRTNPIGLAIT